MSVYILLAYKYEDYWVLGVFDTREKALESYNTNKHKDYGFYLHKVELNIQEHFTDPYDDNSNNNTGEWLNEYEVIHGQ